MEAPNWRSHLHLSFSSRVEIKHGEKGFGSHLEEALLLRVLSVIEKSTNGDKIGFFLSYSNNSSGCKS
jgi:hypothetical protein